MGYGQCSRYCGGYSRVSKRQRTPDYWWDTKFMMESWSLDDGLKLVRLLQPETRKYGYHLALGGSVLNAGKSDKDIDLYFLPLENKRESPANIGDLTQWLVTLWGEYEVIGKEY